MWRHAAATNAYVDGKFGTRSELSAFRVTLICSRAAGRRAKILCDRLTCSLLSRGRFPGTARPSLVATTCSQLHRHTARPGDAPGQSFGRLVHSPQLRAVPILPLALGTIIHAPDWRWRRDTGDSIVHGHFATCWSRAECCISQSSCSVVLSDGLLDRAMAECGTRR